MTAPAQDLERRPYEQLVVVPGTGEVVELTGEDDALARAMDDAKELVHQVEAARRRIGAELLKRLDRSARWTHRMGQYKVTAPSPAPTTEYDADALAHGLVKLVKAGTVSPEAAAAAVEEKRTLAVRKNGVNALVKLGGEAADLVKRCQREVPKGDRKVTVIMERPTR